MQITITCCCIAVNFSIAHKIDSMRLLEVVSRLMQEARTLLLLQKKRQSPQVQMRAIFGVLISKFQLVISAERKNKYISTENLFKISERAGVDKIRVQFI